MEKAEFKILFDTHFDELRRFIFYRCSDPEVASDLAQDVFLRVWEKRDQLTEINLRALLYKMAGDLLISNYRKGAVRLDFAQHLYVDSQADSTDQYMMYRDLQTRYAQVLRQMPEPLRITFLMSRNDRLKYHEIADRLDISIKTVEKRMSAALQILKKELL